MWDNNKKIMTTQKEHKFSYKIWLEQDGRPILGKGGAGILEQIRIDRSISIAAKNLSMSYRYVWDYLQQIGKAVGRPVVNTFRGGKSGGGGADLTEEGRSLLARYNRLEAHLGKILSENGGLEVRKLKISARNQIKGRVSSVEKNGLMAKVKIEITLPATMTAMISKEAAEDLGIKTGDQVEAIVKATEVMISK